MQVSPTEIEETLLRHPEGLVIDVLVAGVSGGRTADGVGRFVAQREGARCNRNRCPTPRVGPRHTQSV